MGENRRGYRGNFWTDEEVAVLMDMVDRKCGQAEIAEALGRTISSVEGKLRLVRLSREMGDILGPGLARYEAPPFRENDERKHLQALFDANGYGFSWWPPSLMERIYQLERAPARAPAFWRGELVVRGVA